MMIVTNIFRLLLFLSPVMFAANINMDIFDVVFFRTGVMILFIASLFDQQKRMMPAWVNKIVLGLFSLCLLSLFNYKFSNMVLTNTFNIFLAILGFYIVHNFCDENIDLKKPILWAFAINLGMLALQISGVNLVYDKLVLGGLIGNAARLGIYSALAMPFLPNILIILAVASAFFIRQYTIFIPIVIYLFMKLKSNTEKILFAAIILLTLLLARAYVVPEFMFRVQYIWIPVLKTLFDRPLIGLGLGQNQVVTAHIGVYLNSYLQFIAGVGILGAAWFIYALKVIKKRVKLNIGIVSLALVMFIEYPIEIPRFWFMIMAILVTTLLNYKKEVFVPGCGCGCNFNEEDNR